jgi:hypothetical protein
MIEDEMDLMNRLKLNLSGRMACTSSKNTIPSLVKLVLPMGTISMTLPVVFGRW